MRWEMGVSPTPATAGRRPCGVSQGAEEARPAIEGD